MSQSEVSVASAAQQATDASARLLTLMQLEERVRRAQSQRELDFFIVNETKRLLEYQQALLFVQSGGWFAKWRLTTVSSIAVVEKDAPFVRWVERMVKRLVGKQRGGDPRRLTISDVDGDDQEHWRNYSFAQVLWLPLSDPSRPDSNRNVAHGLWLARDRAWSDAEIGLLGRLAQTYGYSKAALLARGGRREGRRWLKWFYPVVLAATAFAMMIPVPMTVLAPATVVARDPSIVTAPVSGVVSEIFVDPNTPVESGQLLVKLEDTEARNAWDLARQTLEVRLAEFKAARQAATLDKDSKARLAVLKEEVELARTELDYRAEQLSFTKIAARRSGLLIYSSRRDWIGRPVQVGERIMEISDPHRVDLQIDVDLGNAIILGQGKRVELFLDADPLHPIAAQISHTAYQAREYQREHLVYRVKARFSDGQTPPRVGLRGTAKVYGDKVPLYFFLFRRPIATVRQYLGL